MVDLSITLIEREGHNCLPLWCESLGVEPRAFCMLGQRSTTKLYLQTYSNVFISVNFKEVFSYSYWTVHWSFQQEMGLSQLVCSCPNKSGFFITFRLNFVNHSDLNLVHKQPGYLGELWSNISVGGKRHHRLQRNVICILSSPLYTVTNLQLSLLVGKQTRG